MPHVDRLNHGGTDDDQNEDETTSVLIALFFVRCGRGFLFFLSQTFPKLPFSFIYHDGGSRIEKLRPIYSSPTSGTMLRSGVTIVLRDGLNKTLSSRD